MSARTRPVIAIDGPAGVGKSTAARMLASGLGYVLVDTGALYRGVALAARERGVAWDDEAGLGALVASLAFSLQASADGGTRLFIDGRDRSGEIRTPEISRGASDVSKLPAVRAGLLDLQRRLGASGGVVLEGRDIGTVVFPDAEVKVFLTAPPEIRAQRRMRELAERGVEADFVTTLREIRERDEQDSTREVAPLKPAADAVHLDSSGMDAAKVLEVLIGIVTDRVARA